MTGCCKQNDRVSKLSRKHSHCAFTWVGCHFHMIRLIRCKRPSVLLAILLLRDRMAIHRNSMWRRQLGSVTVSLDTISPRMGVKLFTRSHTHTVLLRVHWFHETPMPFINMSVRAAMFQPVSACGFPHTQLGVNSCQSTVTQ